MKLIIDPEEFVEECRTNIATSPNTEGLLQDYLALNPKALRNEPKHLAIYLSRLHVIQQVRKTCEGKGPNTICLDGKEYRVPGKKFYLAFSEKECASKIIDLADETSLALFGIAVLLNNNQLIAFNTHIGRYQSKSAKRKGSATALMQQKNVRAIAGRLEHMTGKPAQYKLIIAKDQINSAKQGQKDFEQEGGELMPFYTTVASHREQVTRAYKAQSRATASPLVTIASS